MSSILQDLLLEMKLYEVLAVRDAIHGIWWIVCPVCGMRIEKGCVADEMSCPRCGWKWSGIRFVPHKEGERKVSVAFIRG